MHPVKFPHLKTSSAFDVAVVIAILFGIVLAAGIILFEIQTERFSSVYIDPASYTNYPESNQISFVYGIHSYENEKTRYIISISVGDTLVGTKEVELMPGEIFEEKKVISIPQNTLFPLKVSLNYQSPHEKNEVHFWLKDDRMNTG